MPSDSIRDAIRDLQEAYYQYMTCLKRVLDFGDANIEPLVAALDHKRANPVAKAIGLMMHSPASEQAFPRLLDWLIVQSPLYPEVLEALVRAGDKPAPKVVALIRDYARKGDDEAVRHLSDLACRFSPAVQPQVASLAGELLEEANPHVRETAADAIWRIGLPVGLPAKPKLQWLARHDPDQHVREAAREACEKLGS
jgi:hypothetical protein